MTDEFPGLAVAPPLLLCCSDEAALHSAADITPKFVCRR
jgi:hypothetical protein